MKLSFFYSLIIFSIFFSCSKKSSKSNHTENNFSVIKKEANLDNIFISNTDTLNIIKKIINNSEILSNFPEKDFLLKYKGIIISDSIFVDFFIRNRELYLLKNGNRNNLNKEELSIGCFNEYNIIPKNDIGIISNYGKLVFKNYIFQIIKHYDYETSRFYILSFNNDFQLISSICFFGYHTKIDTENNKFKDVSQGNPFINYKINPFQLLTEIKGTDINNVIEWSISENGIFKITENNIKESD